MSRRRRHVKSPDTPCPSEGRILYDGPAAVLAADPERLARLIGLAE
jgi:hypothetical protein